MPRQLFDATFLAFPIGVSRSEGYFVDPADGTGRVVSSGGNVVRLWKVQTSPSVKLVYEKAPAVVPGQDPGFFTTISSNGTSNPIVWALSHPQNSGKFPLFLFAFNPEAGKAQMKKLFKAKAGFWPNLGGNANLVPVVASNKLLRIFGLTGAKAKTQKK